MREEQERCDFFLNSFRKIELVGFITGKHRGAKGTFPFGPIFELVENYGFLLVRCILERWQKKTSLKKKTLRSQVRFPFFLSLNLLKTMDLFWPGEFCSGNQKNKKRKILRSQVRFPFFLSLNLLKTMDLFWSGKFLTDHPKKRKILCYSLRSLTYLALEMVG